MKRIYKPAFLLLIFSAGFFNAKAADYDDSARVPRQLSEPLLFMANAEVQTGTSGLNQYVINRLIFGGYISPERVKEAGKLQHTNNRLGFYSAGVLTHYIPTHKKTINEKMHLQAELFSLEYANILGGRYGLGAYNITFRGNADFMGQNLNFGKVSVDQFSARTIKIGWKTVNGKSENNSIFRVAVGISQLASYRKMRIKNGGVFTDSTGSNVDASVNGYMDNTGRAGFKGNGLGAVVDLGWEKKNRFKQICFYKGGIDNLGIYYIPSMGHYSKQMETPAHITQSDINFTGLGNSSWITSQRDTFNRALHADSSKTSKWVMSPVHLYLLLKLRNIKVNFEYRYITGYLPSITFARMSAFNIYKGLEASPSLQLGGFDTYNINLSLARYIYSKKDWHAKWTVQFFGLESLALPRMTHGAGVFVGVRFYSKAGG